MTRLFYRRPANALRGRWAAPELLALFWEALLGRSRYSCRSVACCCCSSFSAIWSARCCCWVSAICCSCCRCKRSCCCWSYCADCAAANAAATPASPPSRAFNAPPTPCVPPWPWPLLCPLLPLDLLRYCPEPATTPPEAEEGRFMVFRRVTIVSSSK